MSGRCAPLLEPTHAPSGVCKGLQGVSAPTNRPGAGEQWQKSLDAAQRGPSAGSPAGVP